MKDEYVIDFMINSINETNRLLCEQGGMAKEQIDQQIEQSLPGMRIIVTSLHQKMKDANLLA